jgi:hypothetical protein
VEMKQVLPSAAGTLDLQSHSQPTTGTSVGASLVPLATSVGVSLLHFQAIGVETSVTPWGRPFPRA